MLAGILLMFFVAILVNPFQPPFFYIGATLLFIFALKNTLQKSLHDKEK